MLGEALWEISATWAQTDQRATLACREVCMPVRPASQTAEMELEHLLKKSTVRRSGAQQGERTGLVWACRRSKASTAICWEEREQSSLAIRKGLTKRILLVGLGNRTHVYNDQCTYTLQLQYTSAVTHRTYM